MRIIQILMAVLSATCLLASFYFQFHKGWIPCSLCWMQRVCMAWILWTALYVGLMPQRFQRKGVWIAQWAGVLAGLWFAGRHVWLQSLSATEVVACIPGLDILIAYFSWTDVIHALWWGSTSCVQERSQWMGVSLAKWGLLYVVGMGITSGIAWSYRVKHEQFKRKNTGKSS